MNRVATNTNSKEIFDFYEKQQRKVKKSKTGTVLRKVDRCTHIIYVKVMENRYSSQDFLIIVLDASKLAQLIYYSLRYLHFSNANQNLRFVISRIFLITDLRKIRKFELNERHYF